MDKKYLGLGVVYNSIDKGLHKSLKGLVGDLEQTQGSLKGAEEAASGGKAGKGKEGGIFHGIIEGAKLFSLSKIGSTLDKISDTMSGKGTGIEHTFELLDTLQTKVSQSLDPQVARSFNKTMMNTMRVTGLTAAQTETLAMNMIEYGRSADETIKSLPMMGKMVGVLGMEAGDVARMFGLGLASLRATPGQMEDLIKQTVRMQKAYKLTDLVGVLPDIFDAVTKNAARFGKINAETTMKTALGMGKLTAVFEKMGKSQRDAVAAATGFQDKLTEMKRSILDMKAGLEPLDNSIFEMASTMTIAGMDGNDAMEMIMQSADNPQAIIDEISKRMGSLDSETQYAVTARLRRIFGDDVANMVGAYRDDVAGAIKDAEGQEKKLGSAGEEFDKLSEAMTGTAGVQRNLTEAAKSYFDLTMQFANKQSYIKALQAQRVAWDNMTAAISKSDTALSQVMKSLDLFRRFGLTGIFPQWFAAWGVWSEVLSALVWPLVGLTGALKMFGGLFKGVFKMLWWGIKLLRFLGPVIQGIGYAFGALVTVVEWTLGAIAAVAGTIGGLALAIIAAIAAIAIVVYIYWDDIKKYTLKFYNWIVDFTPKMMGKVVDFFKRSWEWIKGVFSSGVNFVKGLWSGITEGLADAFTGAVDFIKSAWSTILKIMSSPFTSIGEGIQSALSALPDFFKSVIDEVWNIMPGWMRTLLEKGGAALGSVGSFAKGLYGSVKGMLGGADGAAGTTTVDVNTPAAQVIPLKAQEGAPANSAVGASIPSTDKTEVGDKNFQAVVDEIFNMREQISGLLKELADRPVQVALQGDARKFFTAMNKQAKNQAGSLGMAGQVGG